MLKSVISLNCNSVVNCVRFSLQLKGIEVKLKNLQKLDCVKLIILLFKNKIKIFFLLSMQFFKINVKSIFKF